MADSPKRPKSNRRCLCRLGLGLRLGRRGCACCIVFVVYNGSQPNRRAHDVGVSWLPEPPAAAPPTTHPDFPRLDHSRQRRPGPRHTAFPVEVTYKQSITKHGVPVGWYRHLHDVPRGFSCFVAHEFLDALPVHKFQRTPEGWREVFIDLDDGPGPHHLRYVLSRGPTPASFFADVVGEKRDHVEVCPEAGVIAQELASRMHEHGGCGLVVDYGHDGTKTDTFRAFKNHTLHPVLSEPGTADLTADVDFSYLKRILAGKALTFGPVSQEQFLKNMGINIRLQKLLDNCQDANLRQELLSGYDMLTNPEKMGERFKFFGVFPLDMQGPLETHPPAGFFAPS
ncbi:hypothetical protein HPB47_009529 [Ixodes persulcatus]|uniref:Uncharacterized protein n=2 Tax=Ixodes persulcatus TaxID=34615 RepID=A0AC60P278_IXOPE|nr:hypothetical protein HPB47_009512 [Ixodes persulcatus]KAG0413341.1 hypothetical protein HPB47_009529 [Ixodes persulcatus]